MYVKEIERAAFRGQKYLEEIVWKNKDLKLGVSAFSSCENLCRVDIPEGVTSIMDWAFNACFSLKEVNLPESLEIIGGGAFNYCVSLEEITLPSGLEYIHDNAFKDCMSLKSIIIPDGVREIFPRAFENCFSLERVTIPDSVKNIGQNAFRQCYSLKEIDFPECTYIRDSVFSNCISLESFNIPESVNDIFNNSFVDCRNLRTLHFPKSISFATGGAFVNCISLESITVDENNADFISDDGILFSKDKKTLVYYPAAKSGSVYTVPDTVTTIGRYAFTNAQNLTAVILPSSVTEFETGAFNGYNIRDIYFKGTASEWNAIEGIADIKPKLHIEYDGTEHIHNYTKKIITGATCSSNGTESFSCSCGEKVEISYHNGTSNMLCKHMNYEWADGESFGCEKTGEKTLNCTECGKVRANVSTAKTPHDVDMAVSDSAIDYDCKNCGYVFTEKIHNGEHYIRYNYGTDEKVHIYKTGEEIALPRDPEKANLSFFGWANSNGEIQELSNMPDANLELTPKFGSIMKADNADVTVKFNENCFDEDVKVKVEELQKNNELGGYYFEDGKYHKQIKLYNIKMTNADNEVCQPKNGEKVTLKIRIPDEYKDKKNFEVFHWFTTGGREKFSTSKNEAWVENGYIYFNVGSFSEFALYAVNNTKLTQNPQKLSYNYKEKLDLTGIELTYTNSDGEPQKITDTTQMRVEGYDSSKIGEQTVKVYYGEEPVEFKVTVQYAWWQMLIRILLLGFLWY